MAKSFGLLDFVVDLLNYHQKKRLHYFPFDETFLLKFHIDFVSMIDPIHQHQDCWDEWEAALFDIYEKAYKLDNKYQISYLSVCIWHWYELMLEDLAQFDDYPDLSKSDVLDWIQDGHVMSEYYWIYSPAA